MKAVVIISTYPTKSSISKIAKNLVKLQLTACVNITKISSIYSWEGKLEDTTEYLAFFKTTEKNKQKLKQEITKSHPYDVPEIAEIDVKSINNSYLKWLVDSTN